MRLPLRIAFVALAALLISPVWAAAQISPLLKEMARYVPQDANMIMAVNVDLLHESDFAKKNDLASSHLKKFQAGLTMVPPDSSYFLLSSKYDFEYMDSQWTVAMAQFNKNIPVADIARLRGGTVDTLAGKQAVFTPDDRIIVNFSPGNYGAIAPANRQTASRWVLNGDNNRQPVMSKYLIDALSLIDERSSPVVMAMDLQYIMSEKLIRGKLDLSETLEKRKDVNRDDLAGLLASIQGVKLTIDFKETPIGTITVDFGKDAKVLGGFGKFLLMEALTNHGAYIEDFEKWNTSVNGNSLMLSGGLSATGMRRIFSLMDQPHAGGSLAENDAQSDDQKVVIATKRYFSSVETLLDDLGSHGNARSMGQIGVWFDKYADKVDRLSVLNVDPDMVQYGAFVSEQLRDASTAIKTGTINTGSRSAQTWNSGGNYVYGRSGYNGYAFGTGWSYNDAANLEVDAQRRAIKAEEKARSASSARGIMTEIKNYSGEIRRAMTQKYNVEF